MRAIFLVTVLTVIGCSTATEDVESVDQNRIYQQYSTSFDEATNTTKVMARFRFGDITGTTLKLQGKSRVEHDKMALGEDQILGMLYQGSQKGFIKAHSFKFIDADGKEYVNSVEIPEIKFAASLPTEVERSKGFIVTWEGSPLEKGEDIIITIESATQRSQRYITTVNQSDNNSLFISTENLKTIVGPGDIEIHLERKKFVNVTNGTERGGSLSASFETAKKTLRLKD